MNYRRMGRTGLRVSEICLGTMTFGFQTEEPESHKIMSAAFERGVNFIDTADVYPIGAPNVGTTEDYVGNWMQGKPRDQIVLATKCVGAMGRDPQPARGPRDSTSSPPSTNPCAACRPTTSTSTSSTRPTPARRSRKPCRRSTTCAAGAKSATRAHPTSAAGSSDSPSPPPTAPASPASIATSRATTSSGATSKPTCCRSAATRASGSSPTTRSPAAS